MEPLTQRVPACPVWTNSFANKCPSPADKIFSWFVVIKNFLPSLYGGGAGGGGGGGGGGLWKDRFKLPASLIPVTRPFFLFFLPLI